MNCVQQCRRDSLRFSFIKPWRKDPPIEGMDLSKRMLLASAVGGLAALCMMRINPRTSSIHLNDQSDGLVFHPDLIRPPGARSEREFLQRCLACGMCMKICPTGGLQPTLAEAGLEGIWTPRLAPRLGYCVYDCNLCGQVCPTEAIAPLSVEEKQQVRIGLAAFDTTPAFPMPTAETASSAKSTVRSPTRQSTRSTRISWTARDGSGRSSNRMSIRTFAPAAEFANTSVPSRTSRRSASAAPTKAGIRGGTSRSCRSTDSRRTSRLRGP